MAPKITVKGSFLRGIRLWIKIIYYKISDINLTQLVREAEPVINVLNSIHQFVENPIVDLTVSTLVSTTQPKWDDAAWQAIKKGLKIISDRNLNFRGLSHCFQKHPEDDDQLVQCLVTLLLAIEDPEKRQRYLREIAYWTLDNLVDTYPGKGDKIYQAIELAVEKSKIDHESNN